MSLPFISGRSNRGGSFAAGPAAPAAAGGGEQDILDLSPSWWMDADAEYVFESTDDSDPVEADEDLVKFWKDKSGNAANFVKTNDAKLAKWYEAGTNGLPYVHFTSDALKHDATADHGTPMAMYFVMSFDTDDQNGTFFAYSTTSGSNIYNRQHAFAGDNALQIEFGNDGSQLTFGAAQSTDTRILQIHVTDSARKIRVNGGASLSEVYGGSANSQSENLVANGADLYLLYTGNYKVYEHLMIPNVTHSEDDVFTYLGEKYDISVTAVS